MLKKFVGKHIREESAAFSMCQLGKDLSCAVVILVSFLNLNLKLKNY